MYTHLDVSDATSLEEVAPKFTYQSRGPSGSHQRRVHPFQDLENVVVRVSLLEDLAGDLGRHGCVSTVSECIDDAEEHHVALLSHDDRVSVLGL